MSKMKPSELTLLRHGIGAAGREVERLTRQVNEMKGIALALVSTVRTWRADLHEAAGEGHLAADVRRSPVIIPKAIWDAATDESPARGGKGVVLLVEPREDGSVSVNVGDLEDAPAVIPAGRIPEA